MPAASEPLARVFAVNQPGEAAEIFCTVAFAGAWPAELARIGEGVFDTLGRCRVGRQKIQRAWIRAAARCLEIGVALHVGQESRRSERIEAGACGYADADAVGLEFLCA